MSLEDSVQVGPAHYTNAAWDKNTPKTIAHFYMRPKRMELKSQQAGEDVFEQRLFIKKITPGDTSMLHDQPARQSDIDEFPREYDAFLNKKEQQQAGTPLEQWPQLTSEQIPPLKALSIYTVEQLASLPDSAGSKIFGFVKLRRRAQDFLEGRSKVDVKAHLEEQLKDRDATISKQGEALSAQQAQIDQLMAAVKALSEKKKPGRPKKEPVPQ